MEIGFTIFILYYLFPSFLSRFGAHNTMTASAFPWTQGGTSIGIL